MECFLCARALTQDDARMEIWANGDSVVLICGACTLDSDRRIQAEGGMDQVRPDNRRVMDANRWNVDEEIDEEVER
jgi:hypothetical protein